MELQKRRLSFPSRLSNLDLKPLENGDQINNDKYQACKGRLA